jgi:histidinol-phosphate aminotransferase
MSGPQPKATILEIEPYKAGRATAPGFARPIKLSANENALGCSPDASAAYRDTATSLHRYPDPRANALREALADKHGLDPERILFGAGSDEIFSMACQAYLSPGENMVQPQYAFAAWAIAGRAAGAVVKSALERNYTVDVDAMLAAVDANTRVVFIANPANPTGTVVPLSEIRRLHAGLPQNVLLVLDGAYAEFAGLGPEEFALFSEAPNVLITRTFSKLHGLASLRVGWAYGATPVIDALNRIRLPFNLPGPAQAAALAALADGAFVSRSVAHAAKARGRLTALFAKHGWSPIPSAANFVTVRIPRDAPLTATQIDQALTERGILVRGLANYGMPECLRVSAGSEGELNQLEAALDEITG